MSADAYSTTGIVADALALQERDEFASQGWIKLVAPAKVNLHLAVGSRRPDGYHDAISIMHALSVHDTVYLRRKTPDSPSFGTGRPLARMVSGEDILVPALSSEENISSRAIVRLAEALGRPPIDSDLEIRIEKRIPFQGGLGGGSTDAAAALVGAARLWGVDDADPALEQVARELGADVAFFLHGGCSCYEGAGDVHVRSLAPSKRSIVLVKPEGGVPTSDAYREFDENPCPVPDEVAYRASQASRADKLPLFNNLASASERLMPQLAEVRIWLEGQRGVEGVLLCGSGATTFAVCDGFSTACRIVAAARERGMWSRATSFSPMRSRVVLGDGLP